MNSGTMCRAVWDSGRSFNRNKVDALVTKCRDASPPSSARVVSVVTKDKKQGRPTPLNTVALLKACSKGLGIGPHQALATAERLYLMGYLSYPRTESTKYPKSFDIAGTLKDQAQDNRWGSYVSELLRNNSVNAPKGGVDHGDHRKFPMHIVLLSLVLIYVWFSRIYHTKCTSCSLFSFHTSAPITPSHFRVNLLVIWHEYMT